MLCQHFCLVESRLNFVVKLNVQNRQALSNSIFMEPHDLIFSYFVTSSFEKSQTLTIATFG